MKLQVVRFSSQADSTSGLLFEVNELGKHFLCYTLEDERRALKVQGETRVPAGVYSIKLRKEGGFNERYTKKYGGFHIGMLHIVDVPGLSIFLYILEILMNILLVVFSLGIPRKRIYPRIAKAIESGEDVTIEYVDFD